MNHLFEYALKYVFSWTTIVKPLKKAEFTELSIKGLFTKITIIPGLNCEDAMEAQNDYIEL